MGSRSPTFPIQEPQHYSDYGFDPQMGYFQVLEEARRQGKRSAAEQRPLDSLQFKLQKPISKDEQRSKSKKRRSWWWKSTANLLFSWKRNNTRKYADLITDVTTVPAWPHHRPRNLSGPIYLTEIRSSGRPRTPCRTCKPSSGPLCFTEVGEASAIPYVNLKESDEISLPVPEPVPVPVPVYLVT